MQLLITLKYYHPELNIGFENIRSAWFFPEGREPVRLKTIIHQGLLYFRFPVSGRRISYRTLKKGLIKKRIITRLPMELLPF